MRIIVDPAACQGHTVCAMSAPELFVLDDEDGHASPAVAIVPADQEAAAHRAADGCPERAITLVD